MNITDGMIEAGAMRLWQNLKASTMLTWAEACEKYPEEWMLPASLRRDARVVLEAALSLPADPATAPVQAVAKPLDLSNLLKHAWQAGADGVTWVDYDPSALPSYARISAALAQPPAPVQEPVGCRWRERYPSDPDLDAKVLARDNWRYAANKPTWAGMDASSEVQPLYLHPPEARTAELVEGLAEAASLLESIAKALRHGELEPTRSGWIDAAAAEARALIEGGK